LPFVTAFPFTCLRATCERLRERRENGASLEKRVVAIGIVPTLFLLVNIVIQRCPANSEPAGNLSLRDTRAHPLARLGKLLISQRFRATFINPAGFRPRNPL